MVQSLQVWEIATLCQNSTAGLACDRVDTQLKIAPYLLVSGSFK